MVTFCHENIAEDLTHVQNLLNANASPWVIACNKEYILVKLKRLLPGTSTSLNFMIDDEHNLHTVPKEIAECLSKHRGKVFEKKVIDLELVGEWVE